MASMMAAEVLMMLLTFWGSGIAYLPFLWVVGPLTGWLVGGKHGDSVGRTLVHLAGFAIPLLMTVSSVHVNGWFVQDKTSGSTQGVRRHCEETNVVSSQRTVQSHQWMFRQPYINPDANPKPISRRRHCWRWCCSLRLCWAEVAPPPLPTSSSLRS
jgi:hypothetical protein